MSQEIISKVWQLHGALTVATPGILALQDGMASFETEDGEAFHVPLSDVKEVKWPFLQFGLGFNATINGQTYKFTFMKPNGAPQLNDSSILGGLRFTRIGRGVDAAATLAKWGDNKKSAKEWKAVLTG